MPHSSLAALFDMDGVIVDNMPYHIDSWLQFARRHNIPLTLDQYLQHLNGRNATDSFTYLLGPTVTPDEIARLTDEKEALYRELYAPHRRPTPGLVPFLEGLRTAGISRAVGTSAPVQNIAFTLDDTGLRPYFDAVVDASMISRGKPDPEIYLTAAERVRVSPEKCVVFEDALLGIEAGLRAGMAVVGVATTHTRAELAQTGVSLIIDDFTQVSTDDVVQLITRRRA